jgi:hypothetical protein
MIKTGDKVRFLNDVGGGTVTGIISRNMVNVEIEGGFEIPYPVSQLVIIEKDIDKHAVTGKPEIKESEKTTQKIPVKPEIRLLKGKDKPDFMFCLVPVNPDDPIDGTVLLYLVNNSNYTLLYHYAHITGEGYKTIKAGQLNPNTKKQIDSITSNDFGNLPEFSFQIIWFMSEGNVLNRPLVRNFKINPIRLYKASGFQDNSLFGQKALIFQITGENQGTGTNLPEKEKILQILQKRETDKPVSPEKKEKSPELVEVDLHINELIESTAGLSNGEMVEIQMKKAESELGLAIQNGTKRIVFIHGVGQGVLKQELAKLLKTRYPKYYFQDASFREYGYGATMVILRK